MKNIRSNIILAVVLFSLSVSFGQKTDPRRNGRLSLRDGTAMLGPARTAGTELMKRKQQFHSGSDVQWKLLNGPFGSAVRDFARTSNGMFFACSEGGIYRADNLQSHWRLLTLPDAFYNFILYLYVSPDDEIIACTDYNTFHSTDLGETWTENNNSYYPNGLSLRKIIVGPGGLLYGASYWHGLLRSSNRGISWDSVALNSENLLSVHITSTGTIICGSSDELFVSRDGGITWDRKGIGTEAFNSIESGQDSTLYAIGENYLYRSQDDGVNWTPLFVRNDYLYRMYVRSDGVIYACGLYNGIIRSFDGGNTWNTTSFGTEHSLCLELVGRDTMLTGNFYGISYSVNGGKSWVRKDTGLVSLTTGPMTMNSSGDLLVSAGRGIYRSPDRGTTWIPSILSSWNVPIMGKDSAGNIFAADSGGLIRSSDQGVTWTRLNFSALPYFVSSFAAVSPTHFYAGTSNGTVNRTTDGGTTWSRVVNDPQDWFIDAMIADWNGNVYCGTGASVLKSTDNGITWIEMNSGTIDGIVNTFFIHKQFLFVGTNNGLYRSSDGGIHWEKPESNISRQNIVYLSSDKFGQIYCTTFHGVYRSTDDGLGWTWISDGNPNMFYRDIFTSTDSYLYIGSQDHGLRRSVEPIRLVPPDPPVNFSLQQNFPNPFNGGTKIQYAVPVLAPVTIVVYNMLGQQVRTLVDAVLPPGVYETQFDASGLASGVYFCRLAAGPVYGMRKMVLLR